MKKMRGVVDPITLGFLIIVIGASAVASKTNTEKQVMKQSTQEPIAQVQATQEDSFFN